MTTLARILIVAASTTLALAAQAGHHQSAKDHAHDSHASMHGEAKAPELVQGEVRAINKERQRITIKHGEIKNLDMAPMTMAFSVRDPAMLDKVKVGDQVEFKATMDKGVATVIELRPKK